MILDAWNIESEWVHSFDIISSKNNAVSELYIPETIQEVVQNDKGKVGDRQIVVCSVQILCRR